MKHPDIIKEGDRFQWKGDKFTWRGSDMIYEVVGNCITEDGSYHCINKSINNDYAIEGKFFLNESAWEYLGNFKPKTK